MQPGKITLLLFSVLIVTGCAQFRNAGKAEAEDKPANSKPKEETVTVVRKTKADSIISSAKKNIGVKYKYGGKDPKGFDCSGFVWYVYGQNGIVMPRTADAQALVGKPVDRKAIVPGDLVYFKGRDLSSKTVGHVGIVTENNKGKIKFISATTSSGIHIDDLDGVYWKERYLFARRVITTK
jgi:cell wall-associated NlpC family hydrolase